jgi:hypothetical protein
MQREEEDEERTDAINDLWEFDYDEIPANAPVVMIPRP